MHKSYAGVLTLINEQPNRNIRLLEFPDAVFNKSYEYIYIYIYIYVCVCVCVYWNIADTYK